MALDAWRAVSGAVVLAIGIVAVGLMVRQPEQVEPSPTAETVEVGEAPTAVVVASPDAHLPGVPDSVTRVLQRAGNVGVSDPTIDAQLPPSVIAVLVDNGVPIAVPSPGPGQ